MKRISISIVTIAVCLLLSACGYNTLQQNEEAVFKAWGDVESNLQRRADLIHNLVKMGLIVFSGGVNSAIRVERWEDEFWHTHQRDQFFGTGPGGLAKLDDSNAPVMMKSDFSKKGGYQMTE